MKKQYEITITAKTFSELKYLPEFISTSYYPANMMSHLLSREVGMLKLADVGEFRCLINNDIQGIKHSLRNGLKEVSDKIKKKDETALQSVQTLHEFLDGV